MCPTIEVLLGTPFLFLLFLHFSRIFVTRPNASMTASAYANARIFLQKRVSPAVGGGPSLLRGKVYAWGRTSTTELYIITFFPCASYSRGKLNFNFTVATGGVSPSGVGRFNNNNNNNNVIVI